MREILFRGKRKNNEKWIDGGYSEFRNFSGEEVYNIIHNGYANEIIPETIGQYTGLTDKNGTMIFEGDIVKYGDTVNKVVFEQRNGTAYFGVVMDDTETWHFCHLTSAAGMEVIGNIHDNPELLGGDTE